MRLRYFIPIPFTGQKYYAGKFRKWRDRQRWCILFSRLRNFRGIFLVQKTMRNENYLCNHKTILRLKNGC